MTQLIRKSAPASVLVPLTYFGTITLCVTASLANDTVSEVQLSLLTTGGAKAAGYYAPLRLELSDQAPAILKTPPADLKAPLYGQLTIGLGKENVPHQLLVVVDEPDDAPARLCVDANANGDLTDDPAADWTPGSYLGQDGTEYKQYSGGAIVEVPTPDGPFSARLGMYRFDKNDPLRSELKRSLIYYRDYAYEGQITLGEKSFRVVLTDEMATGDFRGMDDSEGASGVRMLIDVNGNGVFDARGEDFDVRKPFNIGGTTYEIADMAANGSRFRIIKSSQSVEEILPPPDHRVGGKITPWKAALLDGKPINFPEDYKGKVVLLDFWATWCGPCMREVPGLVKTYEAHRSSGFEILGVTLDSQGAEAKIQQTMAKHNMTWPQVFDGKGWQAAIAQLYGIHSIPATFLVDGDTGEILAMGDQLRGAHLEPTIQAALKKKFGEPAAGH